jgi:hypothetical protein
MASKSYWSDDPNATVDKIGRLQSFNDQPAYTNPAGDKFWYAEGYLHRSPSILHPGKRPAVVFADPTRPPEYFERGIVVNKDPLVSFQWG